jgi:hypothetical protein
MPGFLTAIAKLMPLTHALALMRYAFVDPTGKGRVSLSPPRRSAGGCVRDLSQ